MLLLEESRMNHKQNRSHTGDNSSSATVLVASSKPNPPKTNTKEICRNFQRGNCKFGAKCRYLHTRDNKQVMQHQSWNGNFGRQQMVRGRSLFPKWTTCHQAYKDTQPTTAFINYLTCFLRAHLGPIEGGIWIRAPHLFSPRIQMTTTDGNNSIFISFTEKQKLTGPNFIDWVRGSRKCVNRALSLSWAMFIVRIPKENNADILSTAISRIKCLFARNVEFFEFKLLGSESINELGVWKILTKLRREVQNRLGHLLKSRRE
ncbi:ribonuclease H-like domain-containing protein [Tanacetum coccineum]